MRDINLWAIGAVLFAFLTVLGALFDKSVQEVVATGVLAITFAVLSLARDDEDVV